MSEEISYEGGMPEKPVPPLIQDADTKEMRDKAIKEIEQSQINKQEQIKAGIEKPPAPSQSIPKEVPKLVFKMFSKAVGCEKLQLDDDESKIMARHMSILVGEINSKIASLIVIVIIVLSKVSDCISAIKEKFGGKKDETIKNLQTETVYGDGTSGTK